MSTSQITPETIAAAKSAIAHVLNAIADDPAKFWLMGAGTQSYALLTDAHAALTGTPEGEVRQRFRPEPRRYEAYCKEREERDRLVRHCRDHGIKPSADNDLF